MMKSLSYCFFYGADGGTRTLTRSPSQDFKSCDQVAFAGIWQRWKGPVKKDGPNVEIDVYAFMTTAPNALTDSIIHERMPVLLSNEDDFETWL